MSQIDSTIREKLLNRFVSHWNDWTYEQKPNCFWVREYELGEAKQKGPNFNLIWSKDVIWAKSVWLLDEDGLHERTPLDWRRFQILQDREQSTPLVSSNGPINEIGIGSFAPLGDSKFICEEIWGRRWGGGTVLTMNEAGNVVSEVLTWIS